MGYTLTKTEKKLHAGTAHYTSDGKIQDDQLVLDVDNIVPRLEWYVMWNYEFDAMKVLVHNILDNLSVYLNDSQHMNIGGLEHALSKKREINDAPSLRGWIFRLHSLSNSQTVHSLWGGSSENMTTEVVRTKIGEYKAWCTAGISALRVLESQNPLVHLKENLTAIAAANASHNEYERLDQRRQALSHALFSLYSADSWFEGTIKNNNDIKVWAQELEG